MVVVLNGLLYPSLMDPRARDVSWAKHRLLGASWMDSSLSVCALSHAFSMACPCVGRNGSGGSLPYRESLTSRTRCVWRNTVTWTLMTPLSENQKDLSIAFRAKPSKSIPPAVVFGWDICSSLSSSVGVLTACSAKDPRPKQVFRQSLA